MAGPLSSKEGNLRNLLKASQSTRMILELRLETEVPFLAATVILAFLSIFNKSKSSSPFEALNSACLSRSQNDVRPPVQIKQGPKAFSRVCTGDSDIPSSCEVKEKSAFKPLLGHPAFF